MLQHKEDIIIYFIIRFNSILQHTVIKCRCTSKFDIQNKVFTVHKMPPKHFFKILVMIVMILTLMAMETNSHHTNNPLKRYRRCGRSLKKFVNFYCHTDNFKYPFKNFPLAYAPFHSKYSMHTVIPY